MVSLDKGVLTQIESDLQRLGPLVSFSWHGQQRFALAAATDVIVVLGGSQGGKTSVGVGIASRLIRREGPIYRRLLKSSKPLDGRPMKIWVAPQTLEKFKSNWESRLLGEAFQGIEVDYTQSPFPVFRWHDAVTRKLSEGKTPEQANGLRNELWAKSQDQGFRAFESDVVDLTLFDEEPEDKRVVHSAQIRGATINGVVVLTYTPLLGMSWTYTDFYQPTVKDAYKVADRVWKRGRSITVVQMGMADNPTTVAGGGVRRILEDPSMTQAEKNTRLYGEYGYTEGLLLPQLAGLTTESDSVYLLDSLPDHPMTWTLCADPNKRHGAILGALDPYGNYYLADEHFADSLPDSQHAAAYHDILTRWKLRVDDVLMGADPGGAGAQAIINLADFDLPFQSVKKDAGSVSASIKLLRRLLWVDPTHTHPVTGQLGAPRFYFLRTLKSSWKEGGTDHHESRVLWEFRQYRQKPKMPPDTPIKERDDCVDPCRYFVLMRPWAPEEVDPVAVKRTEDRSKLDPLSLRMDDEFEAITREANKKRSHKGTDLSR